MKTTSVSLYVFIFHLPLDFRCPSIAHHVGLLFSFVLTLKTITRKSLLLCSSKKKKNYFVENRESNYRPTDCDPSFLFYNGNFDVVAIFFRAFTIYSKQFFSLMYYRTSDVWSRT